MIEAVPEEPPVEPTPEPTPESTPEPTATPVPPTETPGPPTPAATATETPAPVAAAIVEPSATPLPPTPVPTDPLAEVEVAGSPFADPHPFVLLGTLLFALAAAAGQVLRSDPRLFRRMVDGFDGVRRANGPASGASASTTATSASLAADHRTGTPGGSASDAIADWPTSSYDGVSGGDPAASDYRAVTSADSYATFDGTQHVDPSTLSAQPHDAPTTMDGQHDGTANGHAGGQAGGHAGSLDTVAKSQAGSLDGFAKAAPGGFELTAHGSGASQVGSGFDNVANGPNQGGSPPSAPAVSDSAAVPADGSTGGHASGSGNGLAKGVGPSGDPLGQGIDANGEGFAQASGTAGQEGAGAGVGGDHGTAGKAAFGAVPPADGAGLASPAGVPDSGLPDHAGMDSSLTGGPEADAGLAESLDRLARSLPSPDGATAPPADGATAADASPRATAEPGSPMPSGFEPSWLGAGALARAPRPELPRTTPPARAVACPSCGRQLTYGHRYCGYCGEPLDKTMA